MNNQKFREKLNYLSDLLATFVCAEQEIQDFIDDMIKEGLTDEQADELSGASCD